MSNIVVHSKYVAICNWLRLIHNQQVLFKAASNIPLIPWYMVLEARLVHGVLEARLVHGVFAKQQGCWGNIEWTKNVCLHPYQDEVGKFSD